MKRGAWILLVLLSVVLPCGPAEPVRAATGLGTQPAAGPGDDLATSAARLLDVATVEGEGNAWRVRHVFAADGDLTVCLEVEPDVLAVAGWSGVEATQEAIVRHLAGQNWRSLSVQAWDSAEQRCRPLSDYTPQQTFDPQVAAEASAVREVIAAGTSPSEGGTAQALSGAAVANGLNGKTVYLSAGHGWQWNGSQWRTQRPVYQGFIEDHNNAEVVTQFLIPYLENAGATVVPVRERDWSTQVAIADNDRGLPEFSKSGIWFTGGSGSGYADGTYQYALSTAGDANAVATWTLNIAEAGQMAVYAWVFPGPNRVPDAHYTVYHAGGSTEVILDQRIFPNTWRYLGTFPFYAGPTSVTLDNRTSSGGTYAVIADAVRIGGGSFTGFDSLSALTTLPVSPDNPTPLPPAAPMKPWWESSTFYWSQWSGLDPYDWSYYNDVVARPIFARWHQRSNPGDAVYVSWHTNGYNGDNTTIRGTVSYVHNGDTYPRTDGSLDLQAAVHDELVRDIRSGWDNAWTDRGKGQLNLGELRMLWDTSVAAARIPGVLLEIAYHDNYEDALALKDPEFNRLAARAVYQGIVRYYEAKDGRDLALLPEPPTHLRLRNLGDRSVEVAWRASPTDYQGLGGEAATGYRVYTSPNGLAWGPPLQVAGTTVTLTGLAAGETVYVKVTATNSGGESFPTEVLGARVGEPSLLIVSGFDKLNRFGLVYEVDPVERGNLRMWLAQMNSRDYVAHHGDAVPSDRAWDSSSNEAVATGTVDLATYDVVDWILGEETTAVDGTLNAAERDRLSAYLNMDRGLLISGSELGWELVELGSAPAFLRDVLHADYVSDDAGTYVVRPVTGGPFAGLGDLSFDAPGEYLADYPDVFAPLSGARSALTYLGGSGDGQAAAVQYADGCRRTILLGFPFETLRAEVRAGAMAKALDFLDACVHTDTVIETPQDETAHTALTSVSGTATGADLAVVWLQLGREDAAGQVNGYWTGSSWVAAETWIPAQGTATWSRPLPSLDEGSYRLRAYAAGLEVDATPAQARFAIDRTAPLTPTVIGPTGGITVTGPTITLDWSQPTDSGSPLQFEVTVDTRTALVNAPPYQVSPSPGPGIHSWRIRALDAAGNVSPWSDLAWFHVEVTRTFLPLILR